MQRPSSLFFAAICVGFSSVGAAPAPAQQRWYSEDAFHPDYNPRGVWAFGRTPDLGGALDVFRESGQNPLPCISAFLQEWRAAPGGPAVMFNPFHYETTCGALRAPRRELIAVPGANGQLTVVRWSAPEAACYNIDIEFEGAAPTTSTFVGVLLNNRVVEPTNARFLRFVDGSRFLRSVDGSNGPLVGHVAGLGATVSFRCSLMVHTGDTVDFAVGAPSGSGTDHATIMRARIERIATKLTQSTVRALSGNTYALSNVPVTRNEALQLAASANGRLAVIDDLAEQEWVMSTFGNWFILFGRPTFWIGLESNGSTSGSWADSFGWRNGALSTYRNWCNGEPNGDGVERFAVMNNPDNSCALGTWSDVTGNQNSQLFLALVEIPGRPDLPTPTFSWSGGNPNHPGNGAWRRDAGGGTVTPVTYQGEPCWRIDNTWGGGAGGVGIFREMPIDFGRGARLDCHATLLLGSGGRLGTQQSPAHLSLSDRGFRQAELRIHHDGIAFYLQDVSLRDFHIIRTLAAQLIPMPTHLFRTYSIEVRNGEIHALVDGRPVGSPFTVPAAFGIDYTGGYAVFGNDNNGTSFFSFASVYTPLAAAAGTLGSDTLTVNGAAGGFERVVEVMRNQTTTVGISPPARPGTHFFVLFARIGEADLYEYRELPPPLDVGLLFPTPWQDPANPFVVQLTSGVLPKTLTEQDVPHTLTLQALIVTWDGSSIRYDASNAVTLRVQ